MAIFEKYFEAGWRDVDPNGHLANSAYLEYAVDTRVAFFNACGFPPENFLQDGFGPVIKSDFTEYFREVLMLERLKVTMENGGFASDGSRFRVVNNIFKSDGVLACRVVSVGGWLSLTERKLIVPPEILKSAWLELARTEDFQELRSSIKK